MREQLYDLRIFRRVIKARSASEICPPAFDNLIYQRGLNLIN